MQKTINQTKRSTEIISVTSSFSQSKSNGIIEPEQVKSVDEPRTSKRKHVPRTPFPRKLYEILEEVEHNGMAHIVSWRPHGRAFVVHEPKQFVKIIMPKHFRQSKYSSFQRQLNLYGFQRLYRGSDRGGYYHHAFIRGADFLLDSINRVRVKGTRVRQPSNAHYVEAYLQSLSTTTDLEQKPDHVGSSNLVTTHDTPTPCSSQPKQAPSVEFETQTDAFYEPSTTQPAQSVSEGSLHSETSDCGIVSEDHTELDPIFSDCLGTTFNIDDLEQVPEDDSGWADLLINMLEDDGDHNSSPQQVQLQLPQEYRHIQAEKSNKCHGQCSVSIESFDCTPLDFQEKPNDECFDTLTAYQTFSSGERFYFPKQKIEKARAA